MMTIAAQCLTTKNLIAGQGVGLKPTAITIKADYVKVEVVIGGIPTPLFYRRDEQVEIVG